MPHADASLAMVGAVLTVAFGLFGALAPRRAAAFVSIVPQGGLGLAEVRATYGGLFLALGAACLYTQSPQAYLTAGAAWLGAALLRTLSLLLERIRSLRGVGGVVIEMAVGLLLLRGAW
jgi:hypothetical protein